MEDWGRFVPLGEGNGLNEFIKGTDLMNSERVNDDCLFKYSIDWVFLLNSIPTSPQST